MIAVTRSEKAFRAANYFFLTLLGFITLYPFYYVAVLSLSDPELPSPYFWINVDNLYVMNYKVVFTEPGLGQAYFISICRVAVGVTLMLLVTGSAAFALTKKNLKLRTGVIVFFMVTMFFSGGLIPYYLLLKALGLLDTFWVLVVPGVFSIWTMIVMKTSFQNLPEGLVEAARMDGASYLRVFFQIVLPLSKPMLAALSLFHAVGLWNEWFAGAFFITNRKLKPLQTFLQDIILRFSLENLLSQTNWQEEMLMDRFRFLNSYEQARELQKLSSRSMESAYVMVAVVPIVCLYPFLQRYFVKGVLIGAIKE